MAVEIPVVVDIEGAFNEAAKKVKTAINPLQEAVDNSKVNLPDLTPYIEKNLAQLEEARNRVQELTSQLKGLMSKKEAAFFVNVDVSAVQRSVDALLEAQRGLNNSTAFTSYIEGLSRADFELIQMRKHYEELESSSRRLSDSIVGIRSRMSEISSEWESMTRAERESARGQELVRKYRAESQELKNIALTLDQVLQKEQRQQMLAAQGAQKRRYENAILNSTVKTMRVLQEQERILSDRLSRTAVGDSKYNELKKQLEGVRTEIQRVNGEMEHTDSKLGGLLKNSIRLLALHTAGRFIKNIREVTSEFELQRVALGSIIQDTDRATDLFRQIKAAAVESPFEIKDLVTYTKQLSAYRIETNKLFDVTMRLADISAGLGVDMNRLVLAYGQVRAASVLRGQELRQFTEAGIPLVELLAEKFQELGREGTTTADVFELISKRAVSFEMVESIFDDMTSAGGMFYKMQEKQAETLLGQWNNLKDALSIMYDEIGNTKEVHNAMTGLITDAKNLIQNWRTWFGVIKTAGAAIISYVAASKALALATRLSAAAARWATAEETKREIANRRLTTTILGKTAAEKISTIATKAHTAAMRRAQAATSKFAATLWLLVAALAKNPFGILVIALGSALGLMTSLGGKTKDFNEAINESEKSIQQLKRSRTSVQQLIDDYEKLSSKANLTAKEQGKLRDTSRELAKEFPTATKAVNEQTGAFILNIEQIKNYNKAVQDALIKGHKASIEENNRQIRKHQAFIDTITKVSQRGYGVVGWNFYYNLDKDTKAAKRLNDELTEHINKKEQLVRENQKLQNSIEGKEEGDAIDPITIPDDRDSNVIQKVRQDISDLTDAYKKYLDLIKYEGKEAAQSDFDKLFPNLAGWKPSIEGVIAKLNEMLAKYEGNSDATKLIEEAITNIKFDEIKKNFDEQLKRLSEEIKRSETARNFYKDIFDLTGDERLATSMSIEVYGGIGDEFKERLQKQLNTVLSNIDADTDMTKAFGEQDFGYILDHLSEIPEKWHKEIKDLADAQQKFSADQIKTWLNELKRAKTYSEERIQIARTTQQRISEINTSDYADEEKKSRVAQYARKEAEEVAKLQYETFKDSPMYVQMFSDLDNATQGMLRSMRNRITELMESWKDLDPVQLKEMQSRLNEIDAQLAKKNPFKVLSDSIKRYNDLMDEGRSMQGDELKLVEADVNLKDQQQALELAIKERDAKRATYDYAVETYGVNSAAAIVAKQNLDIADKAAVAQGEVTDEAKKSADAAARNAGEWKDIQKNIAIAREEIAGYSSVLSDLAGVIENALSVFVSDDAADYARRAAEVFGTFADALKNVAESAAKATLGDVAGALQSGSEGILGMVSAGLKLSDMIAQIKLDEWNKQMSEQDKIIQSLEHSYDRLGRAIERSFGTDYIYNYSESMEILIAQQEAYLKQAEIQAEVAQNASRQADREAAAEQEKQLRQRAADVGNEINNLREKMQEFYAGTSLTSAAEEFADAWLEAYRQFGNTSDAIKEKMEDMINNLIVKASLAKVAERVLKPFFIALTTAAETNTLTEKIPQLVNLLNSKTGELNNSLNAMGQILRASGINLRGTVGNLSGISRDIATASEESILALAAGINTQNFYMSYVPTISADLKMIAEIMTAGSGQVTSTTVTPEGAVMPSIQEMVYDHLPNIDRNLSEIYRLVSNVIKPRGTSAPYYIATDV